MVCDGSQWCRQAGADTAEECERDGIGACLHRTAAASRPRDKWLSPDGPPPPQACCSASWTGTRPRTRLEPGNNILMWIIVVFFMIMGVSYFVYVQSCSGKVLLQPSIRFINMLSLYQFQWNIGLNYFQIIIIISLLIYMLQRLSFGRLYFERYLRKMQLFVISLSWSFSLTAAVPKTSPADVAISTVSKTVFHVVAPYWVTQPQNTILSEF